MSNKDLPTVSIKGTPYTLVKDRILFFNEVYKNGSIVTEKLDSSTEKMVEFKATVTPDVSNPTRVFTGHSQAVWGDGYINKTSAMENAETSACGRAMAMLGIGVIDSVASADEMHKAGAIASTPKPVAPITKPTVAVEPAELSRDESEMREVMDTLEDRLAVKTCAVHNKELKQRENRQTGAIFYDHRSKNPAGEWIRCEGDGWQPSTF